MIIEPVAPYISPVFRVKLAREPWEEAGAARLRRRVFVEEQQIFEDHDRDAIDDHALTIVALSTQCGWEDAIVGTVRIHPDVEDPSVWWGSRLAVDHGHRGLGQLGKALIRLAVCSGSARGCARFVAHVQSQNASFFRRLHWTTLEETACHGHPHHFMEADLAFYPPIRDGYAGIEARAA
ncbi:MAG: MSMEG_0567/Sll0786 family nitrogen starvation N-acetyltransferase [Pseudomonadota bacterium]